MLSGCQIYFGSSYFSQSLKAYKVSENGYAKFDQNTGTVQCFSDGQLPYPQERLCTQGAVKVHFKGNVTIENTKIGHDNCQNVINQFRINATKINQEYSKNVFLTSRNVYRLCYAMTLVNYTFTEACPDEYKRYKIDTRNFYFRRRNDGPIKNKMFYRSPTIAQFKYLVAVEHPAVQIEDDYSYEDHINDYQ
jgi:hypothetical protein